jgi:hypothetical protein
MNCQTCQIQIEELELGEHLSEAARAHMTACAPCRAFHDERLSLRRLVGSLGPVAAPPDFEFRLRARLAAASNGGGRHLSLRSFLSSAPAVALAASFALLVAGVIIYKQMKSGAVTNKQNEIAQSGKLPSVNTIPTPSPETVKQISDKENEKILSAQGAGSKNPTPLMADSRNPARRQTRQTNEGLQQLTSSDKGVGGAQSIKPSNNPTTIAGSNQPVELSVRSPMQPVRVSLDDRSGTKRTVTLEPVVFGSQDFTGGNLTRSTSPSDIW